MKPQLSLIARLFGAIFYYPPDAEILTPLWPALAELSRLFHWRDPAFVLSKQQHLLETIDDQQLAYQHALLFEGLGTMSVPPWASVYLDPENLLMGESTLHYRRFLSENHMVLNTPINEPEDHFALMLMAFALFLEQKKEEAACRLLAQHLLPWAPRYLSLLSDCGLSPFYQTLASLSLDYLITLERELSIDIVPLPLYR